MKYSKIQGLYKRYAEGDNKGKFIIGNYSEPELELLKDITWLWEEKIDGTNMRLEIIRCPLCANIEIKGKTEKSDIPKHLLAKMKEMINKEKTFELFPQSEELPDVTIFGEGLGYKIQNGCKYFGGKKEVGFIVFDINIGGTWMTRKTKEEMCKKLELPIVPIIGQGTIDEAIKLVKNGFTSTYGDFIAEGLVIRPLFELKNRRGHRIITKIKTIDLRRNKMAITRDFKETIQDRVLRDPEFREAILVQIIECLLYGDIKTGKALYKNYIITKKELK